jgi:hypothetical protein
VFWDHRHRADLENPEKRAERLLQRKHDREIVGGFDLLELRQIVARAGMGLFEHIDGKQYVG